MSTSGSSPEREVMHRLSADAAFVRALAATLVGDPDRADDLAQEACLAAVRKPPRVTALRSWLRQVMRNRLRQDHRADGRRETHEHRAAASTSRRPLTPLELAQAQETFRALSDAVLGLRPVQRDVVFLRFYEGLPPRAIAERLGVPVETVKTRLTRGLGDLRRELDEAHGGNRSAWLLPMSLGFGRSHTATGAGITTPAAAKTVTSTMNGGQTMGAITKLGIAAIATVIIVGVSWKVASKWMAPSETHSIAASPASTPAATPSQASTFESPPATSAAAVRTTSAVIPPVAESSAIVVVSAVDAVGSPVAGAEVHRGDDGEWQQLGTTDAAGRLEAPVIDHARTLVVRAEGYATASRFTTADEASVLIVMSESASIDGIVRLVDGDVLPPGVRVYAAAEGADLDSRALRAAIASKDPRIPHAMVGDDGRFLIEGLDPRTRYRLHAGAPSDGSRPAAVTYASPTEVIAHGSGMYVVGILPGPEVVEMTIAWLYGAAYRFVEPDGTAMCWSPLAYVDGDSYRYRSGASGPPDYAHRSREEAGLAFSGIDLSEIYDPRGSNTFVWLGAVSETTFVFDPIHVEILSRGYRVPIEILPQPVFDVLSWSDVVFEQETPVEDFGTLRVDLRLPGAGDALEPEALYGHGRITLVNEQSGARFSVPVVSNRRTGLLEGLPFGSYEARYRSHDGFTVIPPTGEPAAQVTIGSEPATLVLNERDHVALSFEVDDAVGRRYDRSLQVTITRPDGSQPEGVGEIPLLFSHPPYRVFLPAGAYRATVEIRRNGFITLPVVDVLANDAGGELVIPVSIPE